MRHITQATQWSEREMERFPNRSTPEKEKVVWKSVSVNAGESEFTFLPQTDCCQYSEMLFCSAVCVSGLFVPRVPWAFGRDKFLLYVPALSLGCEFESAGGSSKSLQPRNIKPEAPATGLGLGSRCQHVTAPGRFQRAVRAENRKLPAVWCITSFDMVLCTAKKYSWSLTLVDDPKLGFSCYVNFDISQNEVLIIKWVLETTKLNPFN